MKETQLFSSSSKKTPLNSSETLTIESRFKKEKRENFISLHDSNKNNVFTENE